MLAVSPLALPIPKPVPLPNVRWAEVAVAPSRRTLVVPGLVKTAVSAVAGTAAGVQLPAVFQLLPEEPVKTGVAANKLQKPPANVMTESAESGVYGFMIIVVLVVGSQIAASGHAG